MKRLRGIYVIFLFLGIFMLVTGLWNSVEAERSELKEQGTFEVKDPKTIDVILQRAYLDGEVSEEKVKETIWSMEDFWAFYEEWTLVDQNENEIVFRQEVNDLSPLLKLNGYFGLTEDGILSIYEGTPSKEKVIQSFFQIDTTKLKSKQHEQLKKGIPIENLQHYEEVIQAFKAISVYKE